MDQASRQASNCSVFLPACVVKVKQVVCKHAHTTHTERHIGYDDFSSTGDCCFAAPVCLSEASRTSLIILPAQLPWTLTDMIGCWDAERESPGLSLEPPKKARGGVLAVSVDRLSRIVQCNSIMHLFCWIVCMSLSVSLSLYIYPSSYLSVPSSRSALLQTAIYSIKARSPSLSLSPSLSAFLAPIWNIRA